MKRASLTLATLIATSIAGLAASAHAQPSVEPPPSTVTVTPPTGWTLDVGRTAGQAKALRDGSHLGDGSVRAAAAFYRSLGLDADEFSKRAGHYLGEINVLHPFREGNGRTQREFIGQLAQQAGHRIDWSGVSQASMTQASIEAYNGDSSGMAGLIRAGMPDQIFF